MKEEQGRRGFLRDLMRAAIAALLVLFGIRFLTRPRDPHACVNRGVCPKCGELGRCILPQARSARRAGYSRTGEDE